MNGERPVADGGADSGLSAPIFIHGVLPRSGTNFLCDLLLLHPHCTPAVEPVREDLFLENSDHLIAFSDAVRQAWDPGWGNFGPELPGRLQASIGEGLLSFLWVDRSRRLVVKNPSVRRLERFFGFFPSARLLLLIRDGRSVAQSCMDTFGWSFERAAHAWADAADEMARFQHKNAYRADQWRLVRYESLVDDPEGELRALLPFTGLDPDAFDYEAAHNLPVRGSSAFFGQAKDSVNWEPVSKDASFAPKERWKSWTADQHERFDWIAGDQLRRYGYDTGPARRPTLRTKARHLPRDGYWSVSQAAGRTRGTLSRISRPWRLRVGLAR